MFSMFSMFYYVVWRWHCVLLCCVSMTVCVIMLCRNDSARYYVVSQWQCSLLCCVAMTVRVIMLCGDDSARYYVVWRWQCACVIMMKALYEITKYIVTIPSYGRLIETCRRIPPLVLSQHHTIFRAPRSSVPLGACRERYWFSLTAMLNQRIAFHAN